jgi:hypothetical protein
MQRCGHLAGCVLHRAGRETESSLGLVVVRGGSDGEIGADVHVQHALVLVHDALVEGLTTLGHAAEIDDERGEVGAHGCELLYAGRGSACDVGRGLANAPEPVLRVGGRGDEACRHEDKGEDEGAPGRAAVLSARVATHHAPQRVGVSGGLIKPRVS